MTSEIFPSNNTIKKTGRGKDYPGKSITETVINGFFTVNRDWKVLYWNNAAEQLLGVAAKDIIGKNLWEEFAGAIPLDFYTVYYKAFLQDTPVHFEEYWGEMGSWFDVIAYHCNDTLSVSFKSSNQSVQPEHTRYPEKQLQIIRQLYQFVTEVTNDCLWEWDLRTMELFWIDGGHKRVFGYQIENALIPQNFWLSCLHPDDKKRILSKLNEAINRGSGTVWEDEYRFKKANGEYAYVHDRGHIIYEGTEALRMIGATQDITARKLTEIKLLESETKLALIARQTVNAVIITDAKEKITWVNSAFTRITEYEEEEALGKTPGQLLHGEETDPLIIQYLKQKIRDKEPFDCDVINYSKSGRKYWVHIQGQPLWDENGNFERFFAIETDITEKVLLENKLVQERKAMQKEITRAVLTAQENERADIGRELQDNVNQILGAAKLYIEMAKTGTDWKTYLEKSAGYIVNVIEEISKISLALARPGMNALGLFESIKNLSNDLMVIHPIKIQFNAGDIREEEMAEKLKLTVYRIVQEQLNNILKHAKATEATINLARQAGEIILLIADNGQGFDNSTEKKGVGIINIKSRAELYHGRVRITSKPGQGYTLKVTLSLNGG
jgi:PAS domain S-box-containing protein